MQAEELAKATEEVASLKSQLASEKEANTTHIEEIETSARAAAQTAEAKQMDLHDDILTGDDRDNVLKGGDGEDELRGGGGQSRIKLCRGFGEAGLAFNE